MTEPLRATEVLREDETRGEAAERAVAPRLIEGFSGGGEATPLMRLELVGECLVGGVEDIGIVEHWVA